MSTYKTTIGIEVHAELKTVSKMFCACANNPHASEPNAHTCPVCLAHPGTLPVVNKEAVKSLLVMGKAIGGTLADFSEFDRKNYFYPDIPKAYQISQYQYPFVTGGTVAGVAITRVHLEEDTARSQHDQGEESLVDFNRAGVPLMELVTEPVIHSPEQAGTFAKELQLLLRTLGIADANMEKGEMRVEANISVSQSAEFGTKVEVKNLNSFRSMESAIAYEVDRQIKLLESGEAVVQETRGWDEQKNKTFSQRKKETAHDYRYFPDPDIPKFSRSNIADFSDSRLDEIMPELPSIIRQNYTNLGLTSDQIEIILSDSRYLITFRTLLSVISDNVEPKFAANYFLSDVLSVTDENTSFAEFNLVGFAELLKLLSEKTINSRVAKDLLPEIAFTSLMPESIAKERGLLQQSDASALESVVAEVLATHPAVVVDLKSGKEAALQFLVGQGMKATRGTANPTVLADLIRKQVV